MSKSSEYNNKIIVKQEKIVKEKVYSYYNNECSYKELENENSKLFDKYKQLEKIIDDELKNDK